MNKLMVVKLTDSQAESLIGETWDGVTFFNPTTDANNIKFVSQEEVNGCNKPEFQWLKSCELIEYNPVVFNFPL